MINSADKIQHPFIKKTVIKADLGGTFLNVIKAIYDKLIANIILNSEKLSFLKKIRNNTDAQSCHL